ncbi:hypothetical protein V8C37DRAFT_386356 [Trichoderma ceciliae]
MAATPPLVTSDLLSLSEGSAAPGMNETREGIASVISTIRAQVTEPPFPATGSVSHHRPATGANTMTGSILPGLVSEAPAGLSSKEMPASLPLARSASVSSSASNELAANAVERSDSFPYSHHSDERHRVSPPLPESLMGEIVQSHDAAIPPKAAYQQGHGGQNGTPRSSAPPNAIQGQDKSKAYATLLELVRATDAAVVRQVCRENWHKCLVGSDYHSAFMVNATITSCSPAILGRTVHELGDIMVKTSKREIAKHFSSEDLDEVADLIGPKLSAQFQDRVMATRLETIGAQDLINSLARAERLGYHVNDIVDKKPGGGGETVIPSMSAVPTHPPIPSKHGHVGGPPPPMPPHQIQRPPQHPQPYISPESQNPAPPLSNEAYSLQDGMISFRIPPTATPSGKTSQSTSESPPRVAYCRMCHRACSSADALNYHMKRARCLDPKSQGSTTVDTCIHCGCHFESPGGLSYHTRSNVCGKHVDKTKMLMIELLRKNASNQSAGTHMAPGTMSSVASLPNSNLTPKLKMAGSALTPSPSANDPYAKLAPRERAKFDAEMKSVEQYYVGQMQEAAAKLPPGQREEELAKLKNRYNTKQSNTRKKYGIRLRERRTNAEMERSSVATPADYTQASKKARVDDGQAKQTQAAPQVIESPRRRVPLSEMGGLSASSATAELVDPTASSMASRPPPPANGQSAALTAPTAAAQGAPPGAYQGTPDDPMQIDDDSGTDTDSDSVDIPARIKPT